MKVKSINFCPRTKIFHYHLDSIIGVIAIFMMTAALKMISPTTVAVLRALEIIFAFAFQIIVMRQFPNITCIIGAILVTSSMCGISFEERITKRNTMELPNQSNSREYHLPRIVHIGPNFRTLRSFWYILLYLTLRFVKFILKFVSKIYLFIKMP